MDEADPQPRQPIEYSAKDERGDGDRGFEGIADEVSQVVSTEHLGGSDAGRMDEHKSPERQRRLQNRKHAGVIPIGAVDVGAHHGTDDTIICHHSLEFRDREGRFLEGEKRQPAEATGCCLHQRGQCLVGVAGERFGRVPCQRVEVQAGTQ
jgi:hypothetical protein